MKPTSQSDRDLPPDLYPEILSRLPVKSLLRFRCVSKPWLALVDEDADFPRLHLNTFKNNRDETHLIVEQIVRQYYACYLDINREGFAVRPSDTFEPVSEVISTPYFDNQSCAVSSLHGLILLKKGVAKIDEKFGDLKLWNPSIRKLREIPPLLKPTQVRVKYVRDKDIGLGYDVVAKSYKHVKLICVNNTLHSVAIYTLEADSWKIIDEGFNWHWDLDVFHNAVYFQGSLYFISRDLNKHNFWDLVRFDLSKAVFSSIGVGKPNWWSPKLVSFDGGGPSVVAFDIDSSDWYMWALDRESMCWTKPHEDALDDDHYLFHVKKNGDILTFRKPNTTSIWEEDSSVMSINHETGERKTLYPPLEFGHVSCYVESLILHK